MVEVVYGKDRTTFDFDKLNKDLNLHSQEVRSVRHVVPKSHLPHAILHENTSQDRHLRMKLELLSVQRNRQAVSLDISKRTFVDNQVRKNQKWKRDDEIRMSSFNIPQLREDTGNGPKRNKGQADPNIDVYYHGPRYLSPEMPRDGPVVLPYMKVRRERTEVVKHQEQTFITRLPTTIEVDLDHFRQYNHYCGTGLLKGRCVEDTRFKNLNKLLSPIIKDVEDIKLPRFRKACYSKRKANTPSQVEPLPVLITGKSVNRNVYIRTTSSRKKRRSQQSPDSPLNKVDLTKIPTVIITGSYNEEMNGNDGSDDSGKIFQTDRSKKSTKEVNDENDLPPPSQKIKNKKTKQSLNIKNQNVDRINKKMRKHQLLDLESM